MRVKHTDEFYSRRTKALSKRNILNLFFVSMALFSLTNLLKFTYLICENLLYKFTNITNVFRTGNIFEAGIRTDDDTALVVEVLVSKLVEYAKEKNGSECR